MQGIDFVSVFKILFLILMTRALMNQYDLLTDALWDWSDSFAGGLQRSVFGEANVFWLAKYIWNISTGFSFHVSSLLHPSVFFAQLSASVMAFLLALLAVFSTVWSLWGFVLTKMIGFMFLPCLMFKPLSWLFEGWLRLFFGFLLYNVLARANLILVVIALKSYTKIS